MNLRGGRQVGLFTAFYDQSKGWTPILTALEEVRWPLFRAPKQSWYRIGADEERDTREFLVQDPDGYLVRLSQTSANAPLADLNTNDSCMVEGTSHRIKSLLMVLRCRKHRSHSICQHCAFTRSPHRSIVPAALGASAATFIPFCGCCSPGPASLNWAAVGAGTPKR